MDDHPAVLGSRIDKTSKVCYNKDIVPFDNEFLYIAFNKPVGYVCSRRAQGSAPTLYELLPPEYRRLKTVGRLDKDSSGLILLTNDGDFAYQMTHPSFRKTKVYEVVLNQPLEPLHQQMISDYGVMLDDGPSQFKVIRDTAPEGLKTMQVNGAEESDEFFGAFRSAAARELAPSARGDGPDGRGPEKLHPTPTAPSHYIVILHEGRNRQIRRTFAALGYNVVRLHRTQFGPYELNGLEPGKYDIIKP